MRIRHYIAGEFLPQPLLDTGVPKIDPAWAWVVTPDDSELPFALILGSYAHGWLMLWRLLSVQPLPRGVARYWFLEAMPRLLENAKQQGCVGMLSLLSDTKSCEVKLARLILRIGGQLIPFRGSVAVAVLN